MPSDMPILILNYSLPILHYISSLLAQRVQALIHRYTYTPLPSPPQNIIIIGGSFSGLYLAFRLSESLPPGYKVILVEQNSHFNYVFNFPRYSVIQGREERAFVPYDGLFGNVPKGVFERVRGRAVGITYDDKHRDGEEEEEEEGKRAHEHGKVELESGEFLDFDYLAIATGVLQLPPAKLLSTSKEIACAELQKLQTRILESEDIAIVGAGAVGVQLATDIKTFYPEKRVALVHSRERILSSFGERLHHFVMGRLGEMGVEVLLEERPMLPEKSNWEPFEVAFKEGRKRLFDLVIPCTGQTPNSSLISHFSPSSISPLTNRILVNKHLQLLNASEVDSDGSKTDTPFSNIFALGDVAETGGPKFARAGAAQAEIVRENIVALIKSKEMGKEKLTSYIPSALEGLLKLSLGKDECVIYMQDEKRDYMFSGKLKNIDLEVEKAWKLFGADMKNAKTL